jgi:acyl carrier protein
MSQPLRDTLRQFLLNELGAGGRVDTLSDDTPLFGHHGVIDSLVILDLVTFLEQTFGFQVAGHEVTEDHFGTITRIATYIEGRRT